MIEAGDDLARRYTEEEERRLALNLEGLLEQIHRGDFIDASITVRLLEEFHASLFHQVRDHGGRMRSRGRGAEYLLFGPNRSEHRDDTPRLVRAAIEQVRRNADRIRDDPSSANYELAGLTVAITAQAELIRIHPFEDGNGRSVRAFTDYLLILFGLRPIPVEAVKSEYNECLNHYHRRSDIQPLLDLFLRLYPVDSDPPP